MRKKSIILLLFIFLTINLTTTHAYWASHLTSSESGATSSVTIGTWTMGTTYDFDETILDDLIDVGSSIVSGSFNDTGTSLQSSGGLLYIPNPLESYTINVNAQILTSGTYGGYGILFDTFVNNASTQSDTGWALQFDRGYSGGEIIIRPRSYGGEQNPVSRYGIRFDAQGELTTSGGIKDNTNSWWTEAHTLKLEVSVLNEATQQKRLMVYIDNIYLFTYDYTSTIFEPVSDQNVTGFRTWSGVNVAFYELSIIPT